MNDWPPKFRLITVLATTKYLLSRSDKEGLGFEEPRSVEAQVQELLSLLLGDPGAQAPEHYTILFAPTGPIQEISLANGWGEVYIKLAEEFDKLEYLIVEEIKRNP